MQKTSVYISQIVVGDTIEHNGEIVTVSQNNIRECKFMGKCIFGDSYNIGTKPVTKIVFKGK